MPTVDRRSLPLSENAFRKCLDSSPALAYFTVTSDRPAFHQKGSAMLHRKSLRSTVAYVVFGFGISGSISCGPAMVTQGDQDKAKSALATPASGSAISTVLGV
ncbi:MAG: hypothetical protein ACREPG_05110, partial [Candidatus Binatia bacterium]